MSEMSASEAARRLKVTSRAVRRYCEAYGIGRKVLNVWVLTESDLPKLKAAGIGKQAGNPDWIALGEANRKAKKARKKRRSGR